MSESSCKSLLSRVLATDSNEKHSCKTDWKAEHRLAFYGGLQADARAESRWRLAVALGQTPKKHLLGNPAARAGGEVPHDSRL